MKLSILRIIEIVLVLTMIVAIFLPFISNITPYEYAFGRMKEFLKVSAISLPIMLLIPYLLLLLFQDKLKDSMLKILKIISIFIYLLVFGCYVFIFIKDMNSPEYFCLIALLLSLTLILMSFLISKEKKNYLLNTILATITLPFVFHMVFLVFDFQSLKNGGLIIEFSFILLYVIGFSKIFRPSKRIN